MEKLYRNILVIGATSRNLGKTTLICNLLKRFSDYPVTAVKIKTIRIGDEAYHGGDTILEKPFIIRRTHELSGKSDTERLLLAGASQVLYVKSEHNALKEAFGETMKLVPAGNLIIMESNSIVELIIPGVYILIKGNNPVIFKPSSLTTEKAADIILTSNGARHSTPANLLPVSVKGSGWYLTGSLPTAEF